MIRRKMATNKAGAESIVLCAEIANDKVKFVTKRDYNLQKLGVGAYKLEFDDCIANELDTRPQVCDDRFVVVVNKTANNALVGILITNAEMNLDKNSPIFELQRTTVPVPVVMHQDDEITSTGPEIPQLRLPPTHSKTSLLDHYYVESRRSSEQ
ncbi:telokin-like protein 20 [Epinotia aporema granulovirus]|uniref:Telokin-like protein 20 n=1 Tax=Epinotia aporema granulovirus TaxID=166056 RepID=K4EQF2_9BBAC|nr:telokin-like protein 20 [Epinotia aporema granulovirus]AER41523.1 telokin-like protein 20 [Epinotia aporema granulovirus]